MTTHPFDTDLDTALVDNPCCCCGKFDLAVAIVNCNGVTDDNYDFWMSGSLLVSLTEPIPTGPTDPTDPCTEVSLRNRGHWLTPPSYTGPHPTSSNLWCGAETTDPVLWDDHTITAFHDMGDACVFQFALRTTNNNGCQNFGHIYFYRVIKGDASATPATLDSLCLIQTTNYEPTSYTPITSPTSGTYYCVYNNGFGTPRSNAICSTVSGDNFSGPFSTDAACNDLCNFEFYYLNRCDNGDCCSGYWCMTSGPPFHGTRAEAAADPSAPIVSGPWIDANDAMLRGGCLPYWCTEIESEDIAFCVQGASSDAVEAIDPGFYTVTGGPYWTFSACQAACVFVCPCCPSFTTSPLIGTFSVPGVLTVDPFTLTYNASTCNWTGSHAQFGGTVTMTLGFTDDCHLTWTVTVPPFVGPSTTYTDTDTGTFDCSTIPYTAQGGTNLYDGAYGQVVLSLPAMAPAPASAPVDQKKTISDGRAERIRAALGPRKPCNCGQKRKSPGATSTEAEKERE